MRKLKEREIKCKTIKIFRKEGQYKHQQGKTTTKKPQNKTVESYLYCPFTINNIKLYFIS